MEKVDCGSDGMGVPGTSLCTDGLGWELREDDAFHYFKVDLERIAMLLLTSWSPVSVKHGLCSPEFSVLMKTLVYTNDIGGVNKNSPRNFECAPDVISWLWVCTEQA